MTPDQKDAMADTLSAQAKQLRESAREDRGGVILHVGFVGITRGGERCVVKSWDQKTGGFFVETEGSRYLYSVKAYGAHEVPWRSNLDIIGPWSDCPDERAAMIARAGGG